MARKPAKQSAVKRGKLAKAVTVSAIEVTQGDYTFYIFKMKASELWPMVSINRRQEDEDRGYQRVLSTARTAAVASHIRAGNPIPTSVLISLDRATYSVGTKTLSIPSGKDIGWVIDGQHRIAGAFEALPDVDLELSVIAFVGTDVNFQIEQFITVNREAKGVPTSLVYDLLSFLPARTSPTEIANERSIELAKSLRKKKSSPFENRIVTTQQPRLGQVSLVNFVRKVAPLVHPERGRLRTHSFIEQEKIIDNYYRGLKLTFPEEWTKSDLIFFKTIGFGAAFNIFEEIFDITIAEQNGFAPKDVKATLGGVADFDFGQWRAYGTGNKAEIDAAQDLKTDLLKARTKSPSSKKLRLE